MDPCITNTNINNARSAIRSQLGVPKSYAKNFTRKQICAAIKRCKNPNSFPPMKIDISGQYIYLIDPDSPLNADEYSILFEGGKKPEIIKVAKKLGLVELDTTINELKANIVNLLEDLKLREPIKAMKTPQLVKNTNNRGNNLAFGNNLALGNNNNNRGNNLLVGNNNNRGNNLLVGNNNNRGNRLALGINNNNKPPGTGFSFNGGALAPTVSKQIPIGSKNEFSTQSESVSGFKPGRPKPSGSLPSGSGIKMPISKNVNTKYLKKRIDNIKDQLGVFSSLNAGIPPPRGVPPSMFGGSIAPSRQSQPVVQHFHMPGTPSSVFGGSTASSNFSSSSGI
jgi:hypothetical protein